MQSGSNYGRYGSNQSQSNQAPEGTRPLVNVLEEMVVKEAQRQVHQLPPAVQSKVDVIDVAGYVLNRMRPMYATNRNGWGHQREKALSKVSLEIRQRVLSAVEVIQNAPPRKPLPLPQTIKTEAVLNQLRELLGRPDLTWLNMVAILTELKEAADPNAPVFQKPEPKSNGSYQDEQDPWR